MATSKKKKPAPAKKKQPICEICGNEIEEGQQLCGCNRSGRLFGPCCNSDDDNLCTECEDVAAPEDDED